MQKIFLDCGGNVGQSITWFKKTQDYSQNVKIFSFEPVPYLANQIQQTPDVTLIRKAVWIENGTIDFFFGRKKYPQSGTLLQKTPLAEEQSHKVESIDFSQWILNNFQRDDEIILKMDIEGAEYEVLKKMIIDGSISYIKKIYIEFHRKKAKIPKQEHRTFIKQLQQSLQCPIGKWK